MLKTRAAKQLPQSSWTSPSYTCKMQSRRVVLSVEIVPVENTGCNQDVKCSLECGHVDFQDPQQLDRWPNGCCVPFLYSEVFLFCILGHSLSASALSYVIWTMKPPRAWGGGFMAFIFFSGHSYVSHWSGLAPWLAGDEALSLVKLYCSRLGHSQL